jgi:hypothetical protein
VEEVLTSGTVSDAFGVSVTVERNGGRWSARAVPVGAPDPADGSSRTTVTGTGIGTVTGPVRGRSAG